MFCLFRDTNKIKLFEIGFIIHHKKGTKECPVKAMYPGITCKCDTQKVAGLQAGHWEFFIKSLWAEDFPAGAAVILDRLHVHTNQSTRDAFYEMEVTPLYTYSSEYKLDCSIFGFVPSPFLNLF